MFSSYINCEKKKNFFIRNWYVKLTVVFMFTVHDAGTVRVNGVGEC
jgi:hypothetical protein